MNYYIVFHLFVSYYSIQLQNYYHYQQTRNFFTIFKFQKYPYQVIEIINFSVESDYYLQNLSCSFSIKFNHFFTHYLNYYFRALQTLIRIKEYCSNDSKLYLYLHYSKLMKLRAFCYLENNFVDFYFFYKKIQPFSKNYSYSWEWNFHSSLIFILEE